MNNQTIFDLSPSQSLVALGIGGTIIAQVVSVGALFDAAWLDNLVTVNKTYSKWTKIALKITSLNLLTSGMILAASPLIAGGVLLKCSKPLTWSEIGTSAFMIGSSISLVPLFVKISKRFS